MSRSDNFVFDVSLPTRCSCSLCTPADEVAYLDEEEMYDEVSELRRKLASGIKR